MFFKDFIYLFLREREREGEKQLTHTQLGTWPTIRACTLAGNRPGNLLVHRSALNPLSHTNQGSRIYLSQFHVFYICFFTIWVGNFCEIPNTVGKTLNSHVDLKCEKRENIKASKILLPLRTITAVIL